MIVWLGQICSRLFFMVSYSDSLIIASRLVEKINNSIGQDPNSKSIIGVLDIYGFESFKFNR